MPSQILCHHTGTPLGDPIEIGALTAVLTANNSSQQAQSLTLAASKSWIGHSEPAAGAVGMAHLCLAFAQQAALPIMHLRSINPHMHPMLQPSKASNRAACIPRQAAGLISSASKAVPFTAGVSAFAFQGTNAHVIMAAATAVQNNQSDDTTRVSVLFQQQRHWVAPVPHAMLLTAQAGSGMLTYHADLATPGNAFLMDHVVSEQCLLPATAFFELALSSVKLSLAASAVSAAVLDTTLAAPLQLSQPQVSKQAMVGVITVQVAMQRNSLTVFSHNASQRQYHVFAAVTAQQPVLCKSDERVATRALASVLSMIEELIPAATLPVTASAVSSLGQPVNGTDAFNMHPAAADSTLQLASTFDANTAAHQLLVPAMLQAMHVPLDRASPRRWACASPMTDPQAADRSHSFGLMSDTLHSGFALQGLILKPLNSTSLIQQGGSTAAVPDCLYELIWPADCIDMHSSTDRAMVRMQHGKSSRTATAAAAVISILQQAGNDHRLCFGAAMSPIPLTGRPSESSTSAMAQSSLLRTAAQELANTQIVNRMTETLGATRKVSNATLSILATEASNHSSGLVLQQAPETAIQGMVQHALRLVPSQASSSPAPFQLLPKPRGALQNLVLEPLQLDLSSNEVLVEVHAVGVNFRDVLNVLGMYPGDPGAPGADCAGVVIARGSAVQQLDIGECLLLILVLSQRRMVYMAMTVTVTL